MEDAYIWILKDGTLNAKLYSEVLLDISRVTGNSEDLAMAELDKFWNWSTEYIDSREWAPSTGSGYIQDFLCPYYYVAGYAVLPIHIQEDILEMMVALEEV